MTSDETGPGLREGIDAAADEFGEEIVAALPATASEARSQLPDDVDGAVRRTGGRVAPTVRRILAEARVGDTEESQ